MKKYHHCVKFTYPLSFQTRIPKVDQHTGGMLFGLIPTASTLQTLAPAPLNQANKIINIHKKS